MPLRLFGQCKWQLNKAIQVLKKSYIIDFYVNFYFNLPIYLFLAQHKAVIFFFVFSLIFAIISIFIGFCSSCFLPNGILYVILSGMSSINWNFNNFCFLILKLVVPRLAISYFFWLQHVLTIVVFTGQ